MVSFGHALCNMAYNCTKCVDQYYIIIVMYHHYIAQICPNMPKYIQMSHFMLSFPLAEAAVSPRNATFNGNLTPHPAMVLGFTECVPKPHSRRFPELEMAKQPLPLRNLRQSQTHPHWHFQGTNSPGHRLENMAMVPNMWENYLF